MCFFNCVCKDPIEYPYASGSPMRPHPTYPIGSFAHTFSALQKRPLLSKIVYDFLTQAGPKNLPKNWLFFGTGSQRGGGNGLGWDGMERDGMGCDVMGCERMGWTGMGWHGMR